MKRLRFLFSLILVIAVALPTATTQAKVNGVDDLRGRWDITWEIDEFGSQPPIVLYINELVPASFEHTTYYIAAGCMRSPETDTLMPLSLVAYYDPSNEIYDLSIYSTIVPPDGREPFVVRLQGSVEINGEGVPDDVASGSVKTDFAQGIWNGEHHDRRKTKCPSVDLEQFTQADVRLQQDLAFDPPQTSMVLELYTIVVSSALQVESPDGSTRIIEHYTDIFSPYVDFVGRFRYFEDFQDEAPIVGEPYSFVLLDILGNPIPGTESTDIFWRCNQDAPRNFAAAGTFESDVTLNWDPVSYINGEFDSLAQAPDSEFHLPYQVNISAAMEGANGEFGSLGQLTTHIIPWGEFEPGGPGFPEGFDFGQPLSSFNDGLYQISLDSWNMPVLDEGGHYQDCSVTDSSENLFMEKSGEELIFIRSGAISGIVTEDGQPVVNVWVDACEYDNEENPYCQGSQTNEDGKYRITRLMPGDYRVHVWGGQGGWVDEYYEETFVHEQAHAVIVSPGSDTENIDFTMETGGSISGTVYEEDGVTPIPYVHVDTCDWDEIFCMGAETDTLGHYAIFGLPTIKTYRVNVWGQPGWANEYYQDAIWWDEATPVSVGETGIDFTLKPGGIISGTVTDAITELGIANIGVDIENGGYGTCTDENGNYTLAGLPFGTYNIVAGRDFCEPHAYAEETIADIAIDAVISDVDEIDFQLSEQPITLLLPYGNSFISNISYEDYDAAANQLADLLSGYVGQPVNAVVPEGDWIAGQNTAIEGLQSGEIDLAFMSWAASLVAYDNAGAQPGLNAIHFGEAFYRSQILTHDESDISSIQDLAGKQLCWADWYSVSGHMVPSWVLEAAGVNPHPGDETYGDHNQVIWGLYNRNCDGGGTYVDVRDAEEFPPDVKEVVFPIYVSPEIPNDGFIFRGDIPNDLRNGLLNAIMMVADTPEGSALLNDLVGNYEGLQEHDFGLYQGLYDLIYQAGYSPRYVWDTYFNNEPYEPHPAFLVNLTSNEIHGWEWPAGAPIDLDIYDLSDNLIHSQTATAVSTGTEPWETFVWFSFPAELGVEANYRVTLTSGTLFKEHIVTNLALLSVDETTDKVTGTTNPGAEVIVDAWQGAMRRDMADGAGFWEVDFSIPGTEGWEQNIINIGPGDGGGINQYDEDGDSTSVNWWAPQFTVIAHPDHEWIASHGWTIGDEITLYIDGNNDPFDGYLYTASKIATMTDWDPGIGEIRFDGSDWSLTPLDLAPNMYVHVTDGSKMETLLIETLMIASFDTTAGTVSGTAPPEREVGVGVHSAGIELWQVVMSDINGNWLADFSSEEADFLLAEDIHALLWDSDDDATQANYNFP